jgi:hypothetical protein
MTIEAVARGVEVVAYPQIVQTLSAQLPRENRKRKSRRCLENHRHYLGAS